VVFFVVLIVGCDDNNNWKPDYIVFANVKQIQLSGLTGKPGIEFNIGYWETNNYNTKQPKIFTEIITTRGILDQKHQGWFFGF
jgi:predicted DNA-binding protein with PD1-like motif